MTITGLHSFDHAIQMANAWLADVAKATGTEADHARAHRLLRAWLHSVRDRLPVDVIAHLGAQLPTLLRGEFYEGWDPHTVTPAYGRAEFLDRFRREAHLEGEDAENAEDTARAIGQALYFHFSAGQLDRVLDALPQELRAVLT
ncbi:DUF2267 domain-containing protein [Streptacidiphilus rugosus]|uniref:DUF2267 domain-containing protein n=1 Tax=Streptacidiphilus rugosus TaxID=405783 RepID=UPI00056ACE1B|nr:DUF2267 domain-containing protein [Streptacidiphilus rugosus]